MAVDEDEDEDEAVEGNEINFNVTVTKGDQSLVFECASDGSYLDIRHISLEPSSGLESETMYTGPVFDELDEGLQEDFQTYLEERGITEDIGQYLKHLLYDKEQTEYMAWLDKVRKFVS